MIGWTGDLNESGGRRRIRDKKKKKDVAAEKDQIRLLVIDKKDEEKG